MKRTLTNYFKASFPCVVIQTTEETRACIDIVEAAKSLKRSVIKWSATEGLIEVSAGGKKIPDTEDLLAACMTRRPNTILILRDPHTWPFERDPRLLRALRDLLASAPGLGSSVVIMAPEFRPHQTIEKLCVVIEHDLPDEATLALIAKGIGISTGKSLVADDGVIRALSGLTTTEAENALSLSFVEVDGFDSKIIYREKIKAVRKSGLLDIVEPDPRGLEAIGGLEVLKDWIRQRKRAWSPEAKEFGLPDPKGCLLVGVPGSGKSLCAKVIGTVLGQPTVRLDIGSLFNSLVGESESRARGALRLAEAIAPCVLWIDEIDKGMAGAGGSGSGDSGVTKRVFGTFISWMQEHKRPVFMVATANDVTNLPPEFLRKGRFDEIFAVDLPTQEERKVILSIHLAAKKRDRANFDIDAVSQATNGFTGSEIESAVVQGLFRAFDEGKEMNTQHLLAAANEIVPLAVTAKEQIDGIREWARNRARFASKQPVVGENGTRRFS